MQMQFTLERSKTTYDQCKALATKAIQQWRGGAPANSLAFLREHPDVSMIKSLVLDLAYEEYCLRMESGESVDVPAFCGRFPEYKSSLIKQIQVHRLLEENPSLLMESHRLQWPSTGERIFGYDIVEELGRGAFARVYLAKEEPLGGRLVSIKVCDRGGEEARTLGRLHHRNIVPIHSIQRDEQTGLSAICMPFFGKATLSDVVDRVWANGNCPIRAAEVLHAVGDVNGNLYPVESVQVKEHVWTKTSASFLEGVLDLLGQLAEGLSHAHDRGILHLDLKPSNVLVSPVGVPMLLDFNLAVDKQRSNLMVGGTLPYMSPEQLRVFIAGGESAETLDERSDVFSLGVIAHELCFGDPPFGVMSTSPTCEEVAVNLLEKQAAFSGLASRPGDERQAAVSDIISRCIAFERGARFETADALSNAIRALQSNAKRVYSSRFSRFKYVVYAVALGTCVVLVQSYIGRVRPVWNTTPRLSDGEMRAGKGVSVAGIVVNAPEMAPDDLGQLGIEFAREGNYASAVVMLQKSVESELDTRRLAVLGYCLGKMAAHGDAVLCYEKAISLGATDPWILNNLGYCYIKLRCLDQAIDVLNRAISMDDGLPVCYHNRSLAFFASAQVRNVYPEDALRDIDKAIAMGLATGEVHRDAARIKAFGARHSDGGLDSVAGHVRESVLRGIDVNSLERDPLLAGVCETLSDLRNVPPHHGLDDVVDARLLEPFGW